MKSMGALIGAICAFAAAAVAYRSVQRNRQQNFNQTLRSEPIHSLANRVSAAVRFERWDRFATGAEILKRDAWTESELLHALEKLFEDVTNEDHANGRTGRDSNFFEFYDCGLAAISEALRDRLGLPQPWDKTRSESH
jgi:hypothetical protein